MEDRWGPEAAGHVTMVGEGEGHVRSIRVLFVGKRNELTDAQSVKTAVRKLRERNGDQTSRLPSAKAAARCSLSSCREWWRKAERE